MGEVGEHRQRRERTNSHQRVLCLVFPSSSKHPKFACLRLMNKEKKTEEVAKGAVHLAPSIFSADFTRLGDQHFLRTALPKIRRVPQMIWQTNPGCELELDGGIDAATAPLGVAAGANVLVAGSAIFNDGDGVAAGMNRLRAATKQAVN
jgi:3-keto-L-gulonate-6-phosphate decarboxylase